MKAYELAWKLLKNGPFCEVEFNGVIDGKYNIVVDDIQYVGKKYFDMKGITRVGGYGEEVDTYGETEE